jgi:hypothetical protein
VDRPSQVIAEPSFLECAISAVLQRSGSGLETGFETISLQMNHHTSEASPQTDERVVPCGVDGLLRLRASSREW